MARMTLNDFAARVTDALGPRLATLLLYGSGAMEHRAGTGEPDALNTLLIVDSVDADLFTRLAKPVREWMSAKHPPPLVLTDQEWRDSADAFPIEYEDIRAQHRMLAGRDPWRGQPRLDSDHSDPGRPWGETRSHRQARPYPTRYGLG